METKNLDAIKQSMNAAQAPEKDPHELEMERKAALLSQVRQRREDTIRMKGRVYPADPNGAMPAGKHFVWVNRNEHRVVSFKSEGYTVVNDGHARIRTDWEREDGTHIYGDLILMEIDKELYDTIKLDDQIRAMENVEGQAMFETFAKESGIPVTRLTS